MARDAAPKPVFELTLGDVRIDPWTLLSLSLTDASRVRRAWPNLWPRPGLVREWEFVVGPRRGAPREVEDEARVLAAFLQRCFMRQVTIPARLTADGEAWTWESELMVTEANTSYSSWDMWVLNVFRARPVQTLAFEPTVR